jgi:hypothetical protein
LRSPHSCDSIEEHHSTQAKFSEPYSLPSTYFRRLLKAGKVFFIINILYLCAFGQPVSLAIHLVSLPGNIILDVVQGLNCGWSNEIRNPFTCDK